MGHPDGSDVPVATGHWPWQLRVGGVLTALAGMAAIVVMVRWPSVVPGDDLAEGRVLETYFRFVLPLLGIVAIGVGIRTRRVMTTIFCLLPPFVPFLVCAIHIPSGQTSRDKRLPL